MLYASALRYLVRRKSAITVRPAGIQIAAYWATPITILLLAWDVGRPEARVGQPRQPASPSLCCAECCHANTWLE